MEERNKNENKGEKEKFTKRSSDNGEKMKQIGGK
jgi:hypothetical protein